MYYVQVVILERNGPIPLIKTRAKNPTPWQVGGLVTVAVKEWRVWVLVAMLAAITIPHYFTDMSQVYLQGLYRGLYYVPLIFAAMSYGLRGSLLIGLTASLLWAPHIFFYVGGLPIEALDEIEQILLYNVVGALLGILVDRQIKEKKRYIQATLELGSSYRQLKQRSEAVEQMQSYMSNILDSVNSAIVTVDLHGHITTCNPAAEELLGKDNLGRPGAFIFPDQVSTELARVIDGHESCPYFEAVIPRLGGTLPVGVRISPLRSSQGNLFGAAIILENLADVRHLEAQVRHADRLSALGELASSLAHEIRNPLAVIRASAQMVDAEVAEPGLKECTTIICGESDRIDGLIERLLDYSRPKDVRIQQLDIGELIQDVAGLARSYANQHGVQVITELSPERAPLQGDEEQLQQCLLNLVFNAVQAMPDGGTVHLRTSVETGALQIDVADTGQGIAPEDLPQIFKPFFSTKAGGTGLGLAIVQRIVEDHGGSIEVKSELGKGTTFSLRLQA